MKGTTLDARKSRSARAPRLSQPERLAVSFYTGAAGRLVSFSIDLGLSLAALGIWGARRAWERIRGGPRS